MGGGENQRRGTRDGGQARGRDKHKGSTEAPAKREEAVKLKKRKHRTGIQEGQASRSSHLVWFPRGGSRLPAPWAFSAWPQPSGEGSAVSQGPAFESSVF